MTAAELQDILHDEDRKINLDELEEMIIDLRREYHERMLMYGKNGKHDHEQYYRGKEDAMNIVLTLLEHFDW